MILKKSYSILFALLGSTFVEGLQNSNLPSPDLELYSGLGENHSVKNILNLGGVYPINPRWAIVRHQGEPLKHVYIQNYWYNVVRYIPHPSIGSNNEDIKNIALIQVDEDVDWVPFRLATEVEVTNLFNDKTIVLSLNGAQVFENSNGVPQLKNSSDFKAAFSKLKYGDGSHFSLEMPDQDAFGSFFNNDQDQITSLIQVQSDALKNSYKRIKSFEYQELIQKEHTELNEMISQKANAKDQSKAADPEFNEEYFENSYNDRINNKKRLLEGYESIEENNNFWNAQVNTPEIWDMQVNILATRYAENLCGIPDEKDLGAAVISVKPDENGQYTLWGLSDAYIPFTKESSYAINLFQEEDWIKEQIKKGNNDPIEYTQPQARGFISNSAVAISPRFILSTKQSGALIFNEDKFQFPVGDTFFDVVGRYKVPESNLYLYQVDKNLDFIHISRESIDLPTYIAPKSEFLISLNQELYNNNLKLPNLRINGYEKDGSPMLAINSISDIHNLSLYTPEIDYTVLSAALEKNDLKNTLNELNSNDIASLQSYNTAKDDFQEIQKNAGDELIKQQEIQKKEAQLIKEQEELKKIAVENQPNINEIVLTIINSDQNNLFHHSIGADGVLISPKTILALDYKSLKDQTLYVYNEKIIISEDSRNYIYLESNVFHTTPIKLGIYNQESSEHAYFMRPRRWNDPKLLGLENTDIDLGIGKPFSFYSAPKPYFVNDEGIGYFQLPEGLDVPLGSGLYSILDANASEPVLIGIVIANKSTFIKEGFQKLNENDQVKFNLYKFNSVNVLLFNHSTIKQINENIK